MALPNIDIQIGNGALGLTIPTNDALSGMILQGPAASGLAVGTPSLITSLAAAEALGINAAYDTDNSVKAHKAIKEFYAGAGTGAELWIMIVSQAVDLETICDKAETDYAVKLLDAANGGIRLLTVVRDPASGYSPTVTNGIDADVEAAITTAQALAEEYRDNYKPLRIILPAYAYNDTPGDLPDLTTRTDNRVAVLLGDSETGARAGVGILLGRLANDPVQRNPGRVKSGALPITAGYIGTNTVEEETNNIATIHNKGFITLRRHVGKAGYFFSDDPTATAETDDYSQISLGRVLDKAIYLAYTVYVDELLDEVLLDADTGRISRAQAKYLQQIATTAINNAMTANNEISGVTVEVDPAQNVLSTGKICIKLRIVPVGYAREIEIELGFSNPANN
jgi:hypothetical protein